MWCRSFASSLEPFIRDTPPATAAASFDVQHLAGIKGCLTFPLLRSALASYHFCCRSRLTVLGRLGRSLGMLLATSATRTQPSLRLLDGEQRMRSCIVREMSGEASQPPPYKLILGILFCPFPFLSFPFLSFPFLSFLGQGPSRSGGSFTRSWLPS